MYVPKHTSQGCKMSDLLILIRFCYLSKIVLLKNNGLCVANMGLVLLCRRGHKQAEHIELVHRKYCKYIIKVSSSTSNVAVLGELGRYSLHVYYYFKCIKFWLSIVHDHSKRVRNSLYHMLNNLDDVGKCTWVSEIKLLLYRYGLGYSG